MMDTCWVTQSKIDFKLLELDLRSLEFKRKKSNFLSLWHDLSKKTQFTEFIKEKNKIQLNGSEIIKHTAYHKQVYSFFCPKLTMIKRNVRLVMLTGHVTC